MNTELLRRILDDARDNAKTLADGDEIRCLMLDLKLTPGDHRRIPIYTPPAPRKPRKARTPQQLQDRMPT